MGTYPDCLGTQFLYFREKIIIIYYKHICIHAK